jgi:hypothetical protein
MLDEPSPYYLLFFLFLLGLNKTIFSQASFMKKGSPASVAFETVVLLGMWLYAFYVIANHYHGFTL